jgi:hypothetical protein
VTTATGTRAYVASHFALEVDDGKKEILGFVRSVEGGGVKADILTHQTGAIPDLWRQIGKPKFDDITFQVGMGMSDRFYKWITSFFRRADGVERRSGAIIAADFGYMERTRRSFSEALISEVQIPGADGSDKNPCYMTVKLTPEGMSYDVGSSQPISCPPGLRQPQKKWLASNFRFKIDGFEGACQRVMKVDGFTVKQQILEYPSGHRRLPLRVPGILEYPNMTFYIPEVDAKPFVDHVKQRVMDGGSKKAGPSGELVFLASDMSTLCTINLQGCDVGSMEPEKLEASQDTIHRIKFQMQVEAMEFQYDAAAVA